MQWLPTVEEVCTGPKNETSSSSFWCLYRFLTENKWVYTNFCVFRVREKPDMVLLAKREKRKRRREWVKYSSREGSVGSLGKPKCLTA